MSRPKTGSVAPKGTWLTQRRSMSHSSPPARPKKNAGMSRSHMTRSVVESAPRRRRSASTTTRGICGRRERGPLRGIEGMRLPGRRNAQALAITVAFAVAVDAVRAVAFGWCGAVEIASSQEESALLSDVARDYNASAPRVSGRCVRVNVTRRASGDVEEALARGWDVKTDGEPPVVWSPAARTWLILLQQHRAALGATELIPPNVLTLMQSPLVIAMPQEMAVALGYPD